MRDIAGFKINPRVFTVSVAVILAFLLSGVAATDAMGALFAGIQQTVTAVLGWYYTAADRCHVSSWFAPTTTRCPTVTAVGTRRCATRFRAALDRQRCPCTRCLICMITRVWSACPSPDIRPRIAVVLDFTDCDGNHDDLTWQSRAYVGQDGLGR